MYSDVCSEKKKKKSIFKEVISEFYGFGLYLCFCRRNFKISIEDIDIYINPEWKTTNYR